MTNTDYMGNPLTLTDPVPEVIETNYEGNLDLSGLASGIKSAREDKANVESESDSALLFSETLIGGDQESFEDYTQDPLYYAEDPPLTYTMDAPKVKEMSPNQAFSSKDFDLIMKLQNNYNIPSEGNFKTNSQNLYANLESPLAFRGMNAAFKQEGVPTGAMMSLKMGDRRAAQKAQELQNWATKAGVVTDAISGVASIAGSFISDRRLKKDIKLIGLSPAGLKIYSFKYKNGEDSYQGVMSDEIPSYAVIKGTDGYDMVDYSKLDVEFKKI